MAMVDVMVRRRRREARARMGAAIAYGAMGWPVCAAAHPPWPAGFRAAVFRSPGFRATGFGAPRSPEWIGPEDTLVACGCAIRSRDIPNGTKR